MENNKQPESQELSAQELAEIAGGAAEYQQGEYSTDSIDGAKEAILKQVSDKVPGYNDSWSYPSEPNESPGGEPPVRAL